MNRYLVISCLFTFYSLFSYAQNLVLNPSFEEYWDCPDDPTKIENCKFVFNPVRTFDLDSDAVIDCTSDFHHSCSTNPLNGVPSNFGGSQTARTGNGYVGLYNEFYSNYTEYIQMTLLSPLTSGSIYRVSFYTIVGKWFQFAIDDFHVKFTPEILNEESFLYNNFEADWYNSDGNFIKDTVNWTKIEFEYIANGTEKHLVIGNFNDLGRKDTSIINSSRQESLSTYYYIDDVSVEKIGEIPDLMVPNVFTPNNDGINDTLTALEGDNYIETFEVYNRWGNKIYNSNFIDWDGKLPDGNYCSDGVYFYIAKSKFKDKIFQGYIHLKK